VRDGVRYRLAREDGAPAITWLREGRLCIISGRGLSAPTLLRLASWRPRAATSA
jgi:hypothetical protein